MRVILIPENLTIASTNPAPGFLKHPDHRVDIRPGNSRVRISTGLILLAESRNALVVDESRHDRVFYLPRSDVDMSCLRPSDSSTYCPFKGHASYFSVAADESELIDSVWSYEAPYDECAELAGYLAFYADRFNIDIEPQA